MLQHRKNIPLDYSLCQDRVTVYRRESLTRRVLHGVHWELTQSRSIDTGRESHTPGFLLIVPGGCDLQLGDRIALGEGPEIAAWADTAGYPTVGAVKHCRFRGRLCHTEARG